MIPIFILVGITVFGVYIFFRVIISDYLNKSKEKNRYGLVENEEEPPPPYSEN